ncbi:MAG: HEAT repeat domain-containing protein [Planctomycetota bacterium]
MTSRWLAVVGAGVALGVLAGCASDPVAVERRGTVAVRTIDAARELRLSPEELRTRYADRSVRDAAVRQAIDLLEDATQAGDPQMRANAYEALEAAPATLAAVAARGLTDENLGVRSIAAVAVGRAGVSDHAAALVAMLEDESPFVRASAEYALRAMGAAAESTEIRDALLQTEQPGLRGHAALLAGELGDATHIADLKEAAARQMNRASSLERRVVELQISEALVKLGDEGQLGPIRAALYPASPSDLEATALAVQIVGELGDRAMRGRLAQLSEATGPAGETLPAEIQAAIAISMAKLGDRGGWFIADQLWEAQRFALRADAAAIYGLSGRVEDLPKLRVLMNDRVGLVRVAAASGVLKSLTGNSRTR